MSPRAVEPVAPGPMELVFRYTCPYCTHQCPLVAPFQPSMAQCENCGEHFPILPVDERSVLFVKLMLANGPAAQDPDFS